MKKVRKYWVIARVSFSNAIAYRAALVSRFCFYTLFLYVFTRLWRAIYQEGSVHGYEYSQMVWYLIMTEFVMFACGTGIFASMNDEVKSGSIVYQLGRPAHYVLYQFANAMGQVMLNLVSFGVLAGILGHVFVGPLPTFQWAGVPALLLSLALSLLLDYFFLMLIGLAAFVLEDNFALFLIYQKLNFMLGLFLPVEFLPNWLQMVAKNLPFSYVFWAPAKIFVSYSPQVCLELIPRQAAWAAAAIALTFFCYHLSVRRLQVNGG
ncbi:MAG: ABC transporter permease [Firmicutes bacterium]|nr:ABC transporter permease [Bacillota bacterium]